MRGISSTSREGLEASTREADVSSWLLAAKLFLLMQAAEASIVGSVRDGATGEPVAGAVVALPDIDRAVVSDADGRYALRAVPAGPQHVTVRRMGYAPRILHALVPGRGELEIDVALHAVPVRLRAVQVRPPIALRGAEGDDGAPSPDRWISAAAVRNHPLLAEPDVFLALGGGEVELSPESPSGVHIRGGASDQTAYVLDGVPVFSPYHAAGTFSAWNPDAIERLRVSSFSPAPDLPDALSGVVAGVTRAPGSRVRTQGSVSTTQARATVDGPLGGGGAGYLVSLRSGFAGDIVPRRESSYLHGESGDVIAKIEAPALGGRARLLAYDSGNQLDAASFADDSSVQRSDSGRNDFAWHSRSLGTEWTRRLGGVALRLLGWSASAGADATWNPDGASPLAMRSERRDAGLLAVVERSGSGRTTLAGVRVRRSRTSYRVTSASGGSPSLALGARTPVAALFVGHERPLGRRLVANVALSAADAGRLYLAPQAALRWSASPLLAFSASYARAHQFSQSLRNTESVVGNVFPADLFLGAGAAQVPVARADREVLAAELRPRSGVRLGAQAFLRAAEGLALVAPRTGDPFATGALAAGSERSGGFSLDAAVSGTRYGTVASYGWQRVRLVHGDSTYVPDYAASHHVEAGVIVFPSATSSIRLGATAAFGRRATAVSDAFEWEGCNLLDQGCELAGSPRQATGQLGAMKLPPYLLLDVGLRKHWHLSFAGRDALVALFGTVTNVLGRNNTLTVATDRSTGERMSIGMRPRAPLVVGLDWRF